jgi:hypothetical protein
MRGMGCTLYIRCALSIHQKECRKILGCALYIGARYLPENTVIIFRAGKVKDDDMAHARCMLGNHCYKHTRKMY